MHRTAILVVGLALPLVSATAQSARRTAVSSFELRDVGGCPTTTLTNARFLYLPFDDTADDGSVLRETITVRSCVRNEGRDARLLVESWPARAPLSAKPRFVIRVAGARGELTDADRWYRVLQEGCCGTGDLWRYYSPETGRELFTASVAPVFLHLSNDSQRVISVHDSYSSFASAEMERDSTVIAVLQFGDGERPSRRAMIRSATGGYLSAEALFFKGATTSRDSTTYPSMRERNGRPPREGDPPIVVLILESRMDPDALPLRIEVPIVGDSLALAQSRTPPGVQVTWGDGAR